MAAPRIWLVGCGNMGGAMLRGWLAHGLQPADILVIDPGARDLPPGVGRADKAEGPPPEILVLGIKPQMLDPVAATLPVDARTLVISILAGVEVATLAARLPGARAYVRVMPNMPAGIGEGISALFSPGLDIAGRAEVDHLIAPLGIARWIEDEDLFHAVTGVSGSGPAFVFRFVDALAAAGEAEGLDTELARLLALHTIAGSARLALQTGKAPADLAESVRSPNGTTHAGLLVLDSSALAEIMAQTIAATARRSRELAAEARAR
ncbi:MAG: pyrroline-5-carboxylate reductase [Chakrabartia sp.]